MEKLQIERLKRMGVTLDDNGKLKGVKKDFEDERDYIFKAPVLRADLPRRVDLSPYGREVEDQSSTGSCVANATCSALEMLATMKNEHINLSRLFVYYEARAPYPELKEVDEGAYLRDGFKVCNQTGVPEEQYWDFNINNVNVEPNADSYFEAGQNKALKYERIYKEDPESMKTALALGYPVIFGMSLYEDFYYLDGDMSTHNYIGSDGTSPYIGGHAMSIVGYDDDLNGGSYIVENSWSHYWGDNGHFALPYSVLAKDGWDSWVCTEFVNKYTMVEPEPKPEPEPEVIEPEEDTTFNEDVEDFIKEVEDFIKKTLKKIVQFIVEFPSLMEIWKKFLVSLKDITDKLKALFS